jgi:hypothetical protein
MISSSILPPDKPRVVTLGPDTMKKRLKSRLSKTAGNLPSCRPQTQQIKVRGSKSTSRLIGNYLDGAWHPLLAPSGTSNLSPCHPNFPRILAIRSIGSRSFGARFNIFSKD